MKNQFMEMALNLAKDAFAMGEVPVGAVIVSKGKIISYAHNRVYEDVDPTAHAEMLVIKKASEALKTTYLTKCEIYVTLEPCPMCAHAISISRIRRLYFAAYDPKGGGVENGPKLYNNTSCHHKPEVYGGIGETQSSQLLKSFFLSKRN